MFLWLKAFLHPDQNNRKIFQMKWRQSQHFYSSQKSIKKSQLAQSTNLPSTERPGHQVKDDAENATSAHQDAKVQDGLVLAPAKLIQAHRSS